MLRIIGLFILSIGLGITGAGGQAGLTRANRRLEVI